MEKIIYNKLVRDKIPDKIRKNGGKCKVRALGLEGHLKSLLFKTEEERLEFVASDSKEQRLAEAADLTEVVLKIWELKRISTFQQKLARQDFRDLYTDDSTDLLAELEKYTAVLQQPSLTDKEIVTATGALIEALLQLIAQDGYTPDDLNQQIKTKRKERGGFDKGYFLIWATAL